MKLPNSKFCAQVNPKRLKNGWSDFSYTKIAGNGEGFLSISGTVTAVVMKLNNQYRLKIVQADATPTRYNDEAVDSFYEDVESAMKKATTKFTTVKGDFNAKDGKKQMGETSVANFGNYNRNSRGDALVVFTEINNQRLMNTFFFHRKKIENGHGKVPILTRKTTFYVIILLFWEA